jgi:hypothetical protein
MEKVYTLLLLALRSAEGLVALVSVGFFPMYIKKRVKSNTRKLKFKSIISLTAHKINLIGSLLKLNKIRLDKTDDYPY